jgi:hypothetical protein
MIIPVYSNRKKAKARFFTAYAVSVLLILVLASSFLKPTARIVEKFEPFVNGKEDHHSAIYKTLHQRMESLDKICVNVAGNRTKENLDLLYAEESSFYASIDSIRKTFVSFSSPQKEKELIALLEAFTQAAQKQTSLARGLSPEENGGAPATAMNQQLLEKEQRIAELENQNRILSQEIEAAKAAAQNNPTTTVPASQPPVANDGGEWKQRYETMRTAHARLQESNSKYATQINDLKKSYKDVVDDNRRLLAQLQAARAGRN